MNLNRDQEFIVKFGKNLNRIRKNKNVSQEKLAHLIGTDRSQISRIERGLVNPTITTVKSIAQILDIDISELFQFE